MAFDLIDCEKLRLFAFPDKALAATFNDYVKLLTKGKKLGFGWFLKTCKDWCEKNDRKPDWNRFYRLCEKHSVDPNEKSVRKEEPKIQKQEHRRYVPKEPETLQYIIDEGRNYAKQLEKYKLEPWRHNPKVMPSLIELAETRIKQLRQEAKERLANGETYDH